VGLQVYGKENISSGASSDLRTATNLANTMIQNWGYSDKVGLAYYDAKDNTISTGKRHEIESEVDRMLSESAGRVHKLLEEHKEELGLLTNALVEYETLDAYEVQRVIRGERIRDGYLITSTSPSDPSTGLPTENDLGVTLPSPSRPDVRHPPLPQPQPTPARES